MRLCICKNRAAAIFLSLTLLHFSTPADAGLIALMRGPKQPEPAFQRVAFVGAAVVREVQGTAEKLSGIDRWETLRPGTALQPGDIIRTRQGTVVLRMTARGAFIKVTPQTVLRLTPLEKNWDRSVLTGREEAEGFVIRSCRGDARVQDATGAWRKVAVNAVIPEGTPIRVARDGVLDLYWTREARALRLTGHSEAILNASVFSGRKAETVALAR
jgi:hypothetical protein